MFTGRHLTQAAQPPHTGMSSHRRYASIFEQVQRASIARREISVQYCTSLAEESAFALISRVKRTVLTNLQIIFLLNR